MKVQMFIAIFDDGDDNHHVRLYKNKEHFLAENKSLTEDSGYYFDDYGYIIEVIEKIVDLEGFTQV